MNKLLGWVSRISSVAMVAGMVANAQATPVAVPTGLVSWWGGDGNANDAVGSNGGTLQNGATYASGFVGAAFSLANGGYVDVPNSSSLHFTGTTPMTLELWAYRTGTNGTMHLVTKRNGALDAEYQMAFDEANGLHFGSISMPWSISIVATGIQMPLNEWCHLAGTFDGTYLRFYINGVLVETAAGHLGAANTAALRIGNIDYPANPYPFIGMMDEVDIYNRALSATEIQSIYIAGRCGKVLATTTPSGAVSMWRGEGNANDSVGSNTGTLQNGATFAKGVVGQGFALTNGAYVDVPNSSSLHFTGTTPMTVELWAYRTGTNSIMHLISKRNGALDAEYQIAFDDANGLQFGSISMPWSVSTVATGIQMPLNEWCHLAGTFDGTYLSFYINGVLMASTTGHLGAANTAPLRIGNIDYLPNPYPFVGIMDEVSIFNRALSATEIQSIYKAGPGGKF